MLVDVFSTSSYTAKRLRRTGRRIGELPPDFGLTEDVENGSQEIVTVANVLAFRGYPTVTLAKRERPDFEVNMPDGPLYIEHTRAFTGYQRGSEKNLHEGVSVLQTDPPCRKAATPARQE